MSVLKKARQLVRSYRFDAATRARLQNLVQEGARDLYYDGQTTKPFTQLTNQVLAASLQYFIRLKLHKESEKNFTATTSRLGGTPHWPSSWDMPDEVVFYAQLNLAALKTYDPDSLFPPKGMLYFFKDEDGETGNVFYYDGPEKTMVPEKRLKAGAVVYRLSFEPTFSFCIGDSTDFDTPVQLLEILPAALLEDLSQLLNGNPANQPEDFKLLGRPVFWKNEDLQLEEESEWAAEEPGAEPETGLSTFEEQPPSPVLKKGNVLLLQGRTVEGHLQFWMAGTDLKKKAFNKAFVTFSGPA